MRPFADDGGNGGGGVPWLSGPPLITTAGVLLVPAAARMAGVPAHPSLPCRGAGHAAIPAQPGPGRDIARLRRDVHEEVEAADVVLSRAEDGRLLTADTRALIDDLTINATAMDTDSDLASIEADTDTTQQRSVLDAVHPQVARLIQTNYLPRQTMLQTEPTDRERRLTALSEQVEQQPAALTICRQEAHDLDLGDLHA